MHQIVTDIQKQLFDMQDLKYKQFHSKLIPNIKENDVIGVRVPVLRKFAKEIIKNENVTFFLENLPHKYYDENNLHAFIIENEKDYLKCIEKISAFLPFIDNWATCDMMNPKILSSNKDDLLKHIKIWISSNDTYTVRFAVRMLMKFFLDDNFLISYSDMVAKISSNDYYVNMMKAWYFSTALSKKYDIILPYIKNHILDPWTHNKTIQKAVESYQINDIQKNQLKKLKIKNNV